MPGLLQALEFVWQQLSVCQQQVLSSRDVVATAPPLPAPVPAALAEKLIHKPHPFGWTLRVFLFLSSPEAVGRFLISAPENTFLTCLENPMWLCFDSHLHLVACLVPTSNLSSPYCTSYANTNCSALPPQTSFPDPPVLILRTTGLNEKLYSSTPCPGLCQKEKSWLGRQSLTACLPSASDFAGSPPLCFPTEACPCLPVRTWIRPEDLTSLLEEGPCFILFSGLSIIPCCRTGCVYSLLWRSQ